MALLVVCAVCAARFGELEHTRAQQKKSARKKCDREERVSSAGGTVSERFTRALLERFLEKLYGSVLMAYR